MPQSTDRLTSTASHTSIVPEAGWALLDLLDKEGRVEEAHRLGLHLHEIEPDPRDRVRILLEVSRLDIEKVAPGSQVQLFEPMARQHPENVPLALMVGLGATPDQIFLHALARADDPCSGGRQMPAHWSFPSLRVMSTSSVTGTQTLHAVDQLRSIADGPAPEAFDGDVEPPLDVPPLQHPARGKFLHLERVQTGEPDDDRQRHRPRAPRLGPRRIRHAPVARPRA